MTTSSTTVTAATQATGRRSRSMYGTRTEWAPCRGLARAVCWGASAPRDTHTLVSAQEDAWVDGYLEHLQVVRGLSPRTLAAYAADLARVRAELGTAGRSLHDADSGAISCVLVQLSRQGLAARSQARLVSSLRGLFRHLLAERAIERDPMQLIASPKRAHKLP